MDGFNGGKIDGGGNMSIYIYPLVIVAIMMVFAIIGGMAEEPKREGKKDYCNIYRACNAREL